MDFFELLKVMVISLIEGITEWLPISSTGHMVLADEFVRLNFSPAFRDLFLVVIQLGAILAVVVLYFSKLNPLSPSKSRYEREKTWSLWGKVMIGCIPAVVAGLLFDNMIEKLLQNNKLNGLVIGVMLAVVGVIFIWVERLLSQGKIKTHTKTVEEISIKDALKVGLCQVLALIPGTSRSGSTIIGGLLSGLSREAVTEFTFFMGVPIMLGASLLKIIKFKSTISLVEWEYLIFAMVATFIISMFAIKFIISYIKKNDFKVFGWYRVVLGLTVIIYFLAK
ncbi:MAG: undecaprenyl-diphosphate phosphatase [Candidatus Saccharibacteria bacterium]|nr:undecaprenyl-diphosphate phosphatase [Candidatus Saccharibacteria bacterium]